MLDQEDDSSPIEKTDWPLFVVVALICIAIGAVMAPIFGPMMGQMEQEKRIDLQQMP